MAARNSTKSHAPTELRRGWIFKALVLTCSSAVALLVVELCLQLFVDDGEVMLYVADDHALYRIRGPVKKRHVRKDGDSYRTTFSYFNSTGFRGEDLEPEKSSDYRIMVYGDSHVAALYSELQNTFARQLESLLSNGGRKVEVINAGVPGYGPDQVLRRLPSELETYRPDLIIVLVYTGNDFEDLLRNKLYRLGEEGLLIPEQAEIAWSLRAKMLLARLKTARYISIAARRTDVEEIPRSETSGESQPQLTADQVEEAYERSKLRNIAEDYERDDVVRNLFHDSPAGCHLFLDKPGAVTAFQLMDAILAGTAKTASAHGTKLVVVIQPSAYDLTTMFEGTSRYWRRFPDYAPNRLSDVLVETCQKHGLQYVNLYDVFVANHPEELFIEGDGHWNDRGQQLAAQATYDFLTTLELLE